MKLTIQDIKWDGQPDEVSAPVLNNIILKKLESAKILFKKETSGTVPGMTVFVPVSKTKIFVSKVDNKIVLKDGDARKAELKSKHGRDYLTSARLTKNQYDALIEAFNGTLDKLNMSASIKLYESDDETSFIMIRYGKENGAWPIPASFPVEV